MTAFCASSLLTACQIPRQEPTSALPAGVVAIEAAEDLPATNDEHTVRIVSPVCEAVDLPMYPQNLLQYRLPPIRVRVDLVVSATGQPENVRTNVLDETEYGEAFKDATVQAVMGWECQPAWRLRRTPAEPPGRIPLAHAVHVIFRFFVDEGGQETVTRIDD